MNPSSITISHNQISGNAGFSGGSFEESSFGGGVGLILDMESDVVFDGNMIMNNRARHGGGLYIQDVNNIDITNNVFAGDTALSYGGAICFGLPVPSASVGLKNQENPRRDTEHPFLANNTFMKNRGFIGGAVFSNNANLFPVIINSIFWENDALDGHDIYQLGSPDLPVYYCDIDTNNITGNWSGEGNINSDPMFLDPFTNNYRIDSCLSHCTNSGIDTLFIEDLGWYYAPAFDISGNIRPKPESQQPDIGAYEVDSCIINDLAKFQISSFKFQTFPNPSFGISDIRYQIPGIRFILLEVFDIHGQKIETLVNKKQVSGDYVVRFDGTGLPAGIYAVRLQVGNAMETVKLLLVK